MHELVQLLKNSEQIQNKSETYYENTISTNFNPIIGG